MTAPAPRPAAAGHALVVTSPAPARPSGAQPPAALRELAFGSMGTQVRLLSTDPALLPGARAEVERLAALLTRFDPGSELCALNADPRLVVPASDDLRAAVRASLAGAERMGGLADPTLLGALERVGYDRSINVVPRPVEVPMARRSGPRSPDTALRRALAAAPARRPARPHPATAWRAVVVDDAAGTIARPPGIRLDLGGSAKGHIADRAAARLAASGPCAVDCGGDMRVHGAQEVLVQHPFGGEPALALRLRDGAIATSGIEARLWGRAAHHLLDPATGEPAWTGVVSATALAPTAAEAEALAKAALLSGPRAGAALLARRGGTLILDDGSLRFLPRSAGPPQPVKKRRCAG